MRKSQSRAQTQLPSSTSFEDVSSSMRLRQKVYFGTRKASKEPVTRPGAATEPPARFKDVSSDSMRLREYLYFCTSKAGKWSTEVAAKVQTPTQYKSTASASVFVLLYYFCTSKAGKWSTEVAAHGAEVQGGPVSEARSVDVCAELCQFRNCRSAACGCGLVQRRPHVRVLEIHWHPHLSEHLRCAKKDYWCAYMWRRL